MISQPGLLSGLEIKKGSDLLPLMREVKTFSFLNCRSSLMVFEASTKGRRCSSKSRLGKIGGQRLWRLLGLTDLSFREARETSTMAMTGVVGPGAGGEVIGVVMVVVVVRLVITVVIMDTWLGIALRKAATLVDSVAANATTTERKGTLLENALIQPQLE